MSILHITLALLPLMTFSMPIIASGSSWHVRASIEHQGRLIVELTVITRLDGSLMLVTEGDDGVRLAIYLEEQVYQDASQAVQICLHLELNNLKLRPEFIVPPGETA